VAAIQTRASQVRQGNLKLFTTSLRVRDLVTDGFYSVETLDPTNPGDKGYQRLLNEARARRLADYVINGLDAQDSFLPTSVFLATAAPLDYEEETSTLTIDPAITGAFSVVDGQHRLEGLRIAAQKDDRTLDFELPVNIAVELPHLHQMCHFLIVNSTQKSVDKSVEQRIISRLTAAVDVEDVPTLPRWIQRIVERGDVDRAVKLIDYLNSEPDSPWKGRIRLPNSIDNSKTVKQHSFVKHIVKYVLNPSNPIAAFQDSEKERKVFLNYWKAIASFLDDGEDPVLYKYNGIELFCRFSIPFFMKCQDRASFTVETMKQLLQSCFDNVEGEYAGVGHPDWWSKGGAAGNLNASAIGAVYQAMTIALNKAQFGSQSIEI
jgi:DGQHR domain-containing protein